MGSSEVDPEVQRRIEARMEELLKTVGQSEVIPDEAKGQMIESMLQDEFAEEFGMDAAALEAQRLVKQYGLRRARKLSNDASVHAVMAQYGGDVEREQRVAGYLNKWYRELPWWKRIFG